MIELDQGLRNSQVTLHTHFVVNLRRQGQKNGVGVKLTNQPFAINLGRAQCICPESKVEYLY